MIVLAYVLKFFYFQLDENNNLLYKAIGGEYDKDEGSSIRYEKSHQIFFQVCFTTFLYNILMQIQKPLRDIAVEQAQWYFKSLCILNPEFQE